MLVSQSIGLVILLVAGLSTTFAAEDNGQEVKPIGYWIERLSSDQAEIREAANEALQYHGGWLSEPPQVPDDADDGNPWVERDQIRDELRPQLEVLTGLLNGKYEESRETATILLGVMGPDARSAEPALLKILRSQETSIELVTSTAIALLHVTPPEKPVGPTLLEAFFAAGGRNSLIEGLDPDEDDVVGSGSVLGSGVSAVYIVLLLASSDRTVTEVPTLLELAGSRFARFYRATAILALAELKEDAKAATPGLRKLLADKDCLIGKTAGWALLQINGNLQELPAVVAALQLDEKERAEFEKSAFKSLENHERHRKCIRDEGEKMVPTMLARLKYGKPFTQRQAIRALAEIGPAAKGAMPELVAATKSRDAATREAAVAALKKIEAARANDE